jgi:hypothetical protein
VHALIVGQEMKPRLIATLAMVAVIGALTFVATRLALMGDVCDEDFAGFMRDHASFYGVGQQTSAASRLPMLVSIRFPKSDTRGGLGFPDRTDVYTLASTSAVFECHAHVRQNRVCFVTFEGSAPPSEFRKGLVGKFPELSIR